MTTPTPSGRPIGRDRRKSIGSPDKDKRPGPRPPAPWEIAAGDEVVRRGSAAAADDIDEDVDPSVLIKTRGLTKHYGDIVAVDQLDLEVREGEIFGLLGPNGAGKTTTILMLLGLSEPTAGQARVMGLDPARHPIEVKQVVGYLPDNAGFYGAMSGRANLLYTAALNGLRGRDAAERVDEVLDQVGMSDAADRRVETYSRGMRQRLGIADALVKDPRVLILDEPTIAIDPAGVHEILGLIRRLVHERGLALLLSSHLLEQVQSTCDRVGIFVQGRLIAQGEVGELARSLGGGSVIIEVGLADAAGLAAGAEEALAVLRGVDGVTEVQRDQIHPDHWRVDADRDVRGELAAAVAGSELQLVHLRRADTGLDSIYRRFVQAEPDGGGTIR
jgi:ABC-2 type transport system ATP-binding protein